jgi:hypothetical protein
MWSCITEPLKSNLTPHRTRTEEGSVPHTGCVFPTLKLETIELDKIPLSLSNPHGYKGGLDRSWISPWAIIHMGWIEPLADLSKPNPQPDSLSNQALFDIYTYFLSYYDVVEGLSPVMF